MQAAHLICIRLASMLQGALGVTGTGIPCFYSMKDRADVLCRPHTALLKPESKENQWDVFQRLVLWHAV